SLTQEIEDIDNEKLEFQKHILVEKQWATFINKFQHLFISFSELDKHNPELFYYSIRDFVKSALDKGVEDDFILKRLKNWRDKKVAHSEKYDSSNFISFEEAKKLLDISKAISEFVNTFFQSDLIVFSEGEDSRFINELIKRYCG
ncbi:MAG: hypothetical protein KJ941_02400, partial [Bacteroidetes bacterium]|nr:hypothetical protein [Bacteroidota bacterium]